MAGFSWLSDVSHAILEAFSQVAEKAAQIDRWFLCHSGQPCHLEAITVSLAITGQLRGRPARPRAPGGHDPLALAGRYLILRKKDIKHII